MVRLALEFNALVADLSSRLDDEVDYRASITLATTANPVAPHAQPHLVSVQDANVAAELAADTDPGYVVLETRVAEVVAAELEQPLRAYEHHGRLASGTYQLVTS